VITVIALKAMIEKTGSNDNTAITDKGKNLIKIICIIPVDFKKYEIP
jgi:hypothetical protein